MIVQIKIDISDEDRLKFRRWLYGTDSKKLASRKEIKGHIVSEFQSFLDNLELTSEYSDDYPLSGGADGAKCPHCGSVNYFNADGAYQVHVTCGNCNKDFSAQRRGDK